MNRITLITAMSALRQKLSELFSAQRAPAGYQPGRTLGQLQRNLSHPALADLRAACDRFLPAPTDEALQRIRSQCSPSP